MNTTPENEPTDEQLDAILRDVQIPADLKVRLNRIPESTTAAEQGGRLTRLTETIPARTPWLSYALAASLLVVATFGAARFLARTNQGDAPGVATTTTPPGAETNPEQVPRDLVAESNHELEQKNLELQLLRAEAQQLEIARLQSELFQLEQLNSAQLSQLETESIIMALAPEHSIALGGDEAYVRSEMARVQKDYPNTRGAMLAGEILQTIN